MQEHAREHGKDCLPNGNSVPREQQLLMGRDEPEAVNERASHSGRQGNLMNEGENVYQNQQRVEKREARAKNVHAKGDHRVVLAASSCSGVNAVGLRLPFRLKSSISSNVAIPPRAPIPMQARPAAAQLNSSERGRSSPRKSA